MYKILIIEDDLIISEEITKYLSKWGYEVERATDFSKVTEAFVKAAPQLVLMDIMLPFFNGYYWCGEIRKISQVPILFLSSASDNMNIVMAVNMGGDDFIAKPFDLEVLSAKIQALLRRTYTFSGTGTVMEHKGVILNIADATVLFQGQKRELTKNEFRIMQVLYENADSIVSREMLMKRLWDDECFVDDNTLTVNITRIRKKLEEIGVKEFIRTQKGMGYIID